MIRWLYRTFGRFWYIFVVAIMVVGFLIIATSKKELKVYDSEKGKSTYTIEQETETEKVIVSDTYFNNEINFVMQIPEGWEHVIKDGYDTFVHAASASSIQIQVLSYYPMVNNVTEESLNETLSQSGYTLTEFSYLGDNGYYDIYKGYNNAGEVDYIEHVFWDRSHVVKILVIVNDIYYDKLSDEIWFAINSASWEYENPITEGYFLNYQIYGDFEFAVPDTWLFSSTDGALYAYDEETGSSLVVNVLEDPSMLEDISELDYVNFLSAGKSNFILSTFQQYSDYIYGEGTYSNNGVNVALMQAYYANGKYQYILTYEYPLELSDYIYPIAQTGLGMTQIFYDPANDYGDEVESETAYVSDLINAPDEPETTAKQTEEKALGTFSLDDQPAPLPTVEELKNEKFGEESTEAESSSSGDGNVSSFADALIQVADLPADKAQYISNVWDSIQAGDASYAEAYKENDTSLIIMVTTSMGVNYYIYVAKDGTLQDIKVNTEDGISVMPNQ